MKSPCNPTFDLSKIFQLDLRYRFVSALPGESWSPPIPPETRVSHGACAPNLRWLWWDRIFSNPGTWKAAGDPATLVGIVRSGYVKLTWTH